MNWEAVGAIGDFVGGAAVLVTLVYLVVQLRQNTVLLRQNLRASRLDAMDSVDQGGRHIRERLLTNREIAEAYRAALNDPAGLSAAAAWQFDLLMMEQFYSM